MRTAPAGSSSGDVGPMVSVGGSSALPVMAPAARPFHACPLWLSDETINGGCFHRPYGGHGATCPAVDPLQRASVAASARRRKPSYAIIALATCCKPSMTVDEALRQSGPSDDRMAADPPVLNQGGVRGGWRYWVGRRGVTH